MRYGTTATPLRHHNPVGIFRDYDGKYPRYHDDNQDYPRILLDTAQDDPRMIPVISRWFELDLEHFSVSFLFVLTCGKEDTLVQLLMALPLPWIC
jgi:hypothetical protein